MRVLDDLLRACLCVRVSDMCESFESKKRGREIRDVIDWYNEENVYTHTCILAARKEEK